MIDRAVKVIFRAEWAACRVVELGDRALGVPFNGEIYDHPQIKAEPIELGHEFQEGEARRFSAREPEGALTR